MFSSVGRLAWRAAGVRSLLAGKSLIVTPLRLNDLVVASMFFSM
jgi:hypothetical protein